MTIALLNGKTVLATGTIIQQIIIPVMGFTIIAVIVLGMKQWALAVLKIITITKEIGRDTRHMEDKLLDYSEALLSLDKKHRQVHELLLKRKVKPSIDVVNDMIIDLILLKNWLNHANNQQV